MRLAKNAWTDEELSTLKEMVVAGCTNRDINEVLITRSLYGIKCKRIELGVYPKTAPKREIDREAKERILKMRGAI